VASSLNCPLLALDYRLAPEHKFPAGLEDCAKCVDWAIQNAAELNIDPSRMCLLGDSAGGNLSLGVALLRRRRGLPSLAGLILIYPVTDIRPLDTTESRRLYGRLGEERVLAQGTMRFFERIYVEREEQRFDPLASPLLEENLAGLPPMAVYTAEYDILRYEGELFARRVQEAGGEVLFKCIPETIHGFLMLPCAEAGMMLEELKEVFQAMISAKPLSQLRSRL